MCYLIVCFELNYVVVMLMCKGELMCVVIFDVVLELVLCDGLEGLMIGVFVECMQMSKSGVFVYFGLCEDLQVEVVCEYYKWFEQEVFYLSLMELCGLLCLWSMV